jgi:hypothetical protein
MEMVAESSTRRGCTKRARGVALLTVIRNPWGLARRRSAARCSSSVASVLLDIIHRSDVNVAFHGVVHSLSVAGGKLFHHSTSPTTIAPR